MPNYSNSKIYAIRSHQTENVYIGSTTQTLSQRFSGHKRDYKLYLNNNKFNYITSFEILQYDDAYIELIEEFSCNIVEELHKKEGEYIRKTNCVNKCIAGRSHKQWEEDHREELREYHKRKYEKNREKCLEYAKNYREEHKEEIKEQKKEDYEKNKEHYKQMRKENYEKNKEIIAEKAKIFRQENKEELKIKDKEKYEKNKEKRLEQAKEYYHQNKEKIKEQKKEKYTCGCGVVCLKCTKARHEKTKKHIKWVEENK